MERAGEVTGNQTMRRVKRINPSKGFFLSTGMVRSVHEHQDLCEKMGFLPSAMEYLSRIPPALPQIYCSTGAQELSFAPPAANADYQGIGIERE